MALISKAVLASILIFGIVSTEDVYNVNDLVDSSMDELSEKVLDSGDITLYVDEITVAGYTVTGSRIADMTSLMRTGDSWMWNEGQTVFINGTLALATMFLTDARITGPIDIPDPLITVSENSMDFVIRITLDAKASCTASYDLSWTSIDGVTLYTDIPSLNELDLTSWVRKNLPRINHQLVPHFAGLMEAFIHMCESKWLNQLEMIKYNHEAQKILDSYEKYNTV